MAVHNKLVRDLTVAYVEHIKGGCTYSTLSPEDYPRELKNKLLEESRNYVESNDVNELADIFEVVVYLAKLHGLTEEQLMELRAKRLEERGGFESRLFLHELTTA